MTLAVASSIDVLMIGLSFAFLQTHILMPILVIGLITFLLSLVGFFFGCSLERIFGNKIDCGRTHTAGDRYTNTL